MTDKEHRCELCGQRVRVYSGSDGTNSYEGLEYQRGRLELLADITKIARKLLDKKCSDFNSDWHEGYDEACEHFLNIITRFHKEVKGGTND